ncbi:MAG: DUF445 family protein [Treponema sp.]|jgi:uncharacterized membrane protein YheB (UPF0754 family)|nr:DUF445 family protein [Treponema sp.]
MRSASSVNVYLIWIIPPLAGAVIGYITNAVAIKMLFRPLKPIRFLGIRLPFTPGILPRQRHKLAENIGSIVERQLLTPEILIARLRQEDVREALKTLIAGYTEQALNRASGDSSFFTSLAEREYPRLSEAVIAFLNKPEIHRRLEIHGRVFLNSAILRLNVFQRFFLSAGQFENTLHDRMPEIIDDLIAQTRDILGERQTRDQALRFIMHTLFAVDSQKKDRFDAYARDKLLGLAEEQIASLLRTLNIKNLVSDRIDSLDMAQVEHIVLDVMANQLWWINVFGAILGALIGLFQSVFSWFIG